MLGRSKQAFRAHSGFFARLLPVPRHRFFPARSPRDLSLRNVDIGDPPNA